MPAADRLSGAGASSPSLSPRLLLAVFTAAIFLSAALLFAVQPLFAKIVLPKLGGSPAVWSVAMVFFQTVLLAGYAYAHALTRFLPGRRSMIVHLAVMALATLALPLSVASGFGRPPADAQAFWLLGLFAVSIGLPFFALSANGPLLQAWFARTSHPAARDPYFLYAASNVGSFLALLAYPFVVEPFSRLGQQTFGWSAGFFALIALIAVCGLLTIRSPGAESGASAEDAPAPSWREVATWIAYAAVPSGLLIAVTAHISTDVAASPFLWVIPLALYLATFVIAFQTRPLLPHRIMVAIQPAAIVLLVVWYAIEPTGEIFAALAVNIAGFFVIAMVCHGELARRRPPVRHLTAFYLWLSFGGVVGGMLTGLIAMQLFNWVIEFPALIALAALCRPGLSRPRGLLDWSLIGIAAVAAAGMLGLAHGAGYEFDGRRFDQVAWAILLVAFAVQLRVLPFAALIVLALMFAALFGADSGRQDFVRSFFGVHKILDSDDGRFRVLKHGIIEHGAERLLDDQGKRLTGRPEVLTYYYDESPLNQGIVAMRGRRNGPIRIAVVGLGTGSLACQTRPGDTLRYYEIDPAVERIARDPKRFTYISACMPDMPVVIGDARLTLVDAPDGAYDVLVVDAFSSDAIPTHLLTQEAMAIYARKIAPDGLILMHVTNRHMTLAPVVAGVAQANGLVARTNDADDFDEAARKYASTVVAVARRDEDMGALTRSGDWIVQEPNPGEWVWTDDYSNVIGAMIRHLRQ